MPGIELTPDVKYSLRGRITTLNANSDVIDNGIVYIEGDTIKAVQPASDAAPAGWSKSKAINVSGTIYPGMIELHNHLAYNIIPMWEVPKTFQNRDQWRRHKDYRKLMTGPMEVLGHLDGYLQAIVRYTECKLLFSGVTSSQGITLASHSNIRKMYKGMVRNVEQTLDDDLKAAKTKIADIKDASALKKQLDKGNTYLLHLAEGTQESANKHFQALRFPNTDDWAITKDLAGIHAVGLFPEDIHIMAVNDGRIIWSPMSNFLLYGVTLDIEAVKEEGILLSIGSDWSPSGSKNLANELKVAKEYSDARGGIFTNEELVRMVTTNPAKTLQWENKCGSIEVGKKADILVLKGKDMDEYEQFIVSREKHINLVIIDGIPRFGINRLINKFQADGDPDKERITINKLKRSLYLAIKDQDNPIDLNINYTDAKKKLVEGLQDLPNLAQQVEGDATGIAFGAVGLAGRDFEAGAQWVIDADHSDKEDNCARHHILIDGEPSIVEDQFAIGASPLSSFIEPVILDESNVEEDKLYFKKLARQINLPEYLKLELPTYYGQTIDLNDALEYKLEISKEESAKLSQVQYLTSFINTPGYLTLNEKIQILDQAEVIIKEAYVHLNQKIALYATNPIDRLRVLKNDLLSDPDTTLEIEFHRELIKVFNSLRDLHTLYQLPEPFASKVAFLPFFIEKCYDQNQARYIVTKIIGSEPSKYFKKGIEVTHWNGIPIERAVYINGRNYAGSNEYARMARGLDSLTFRPLSVMITPEEEWVTVTYRSIEDNKIHNQRFNWRIGATNVLRWKQARDEDGKDEVGLSSGFDYLSQTVQEVKREFFAQTIAPEKKEFVDKGFTRPGREFLPTSLPFMFKARTYSKDDQKAGYIRIYSFARSDAHEFAREFVRLKESFDTDNLIIDIRNNPGGNILAAEFVLQALTDRIVEPQPAQFVNSPLVQFVCERHSPSQSYRGLDLSNWLRNLKKIQSTGASFSIAHPITPVNEIKEYCSEKKSRIVLITDALCYSASDIFASGFQDHELGKILGVDHNTGAGGANVWSLSQLYHLTKKSDGVSDFFRPLPYGADIRVAIRRTLRTGHNHRGLPLEDIGIQPDRVHLLTEDDLLKKNQDLLLAAMEMLAVED